MRAEVPVWDPLVRLLHWSLVLLFVVAYASGDDESGLHVAAGYAVLAIVALRVVWGVVGTRHARFADFVFGPAATWRYARALLAAAPPRFVGHNPLGGWMVVVLLVTLAATCWTGLEAEAVHGRGPLAAAAHIAVPHAQADGGRADRHDGEDDDEFWEEAHEALAELALLLVFVHIAGVLLASALHRENLIKAMFTGTKRP